MAKLSKSEAVILGLLSQLQRPTGRTKLVKLVYLVDNMRAEQLGTPITGFKYHRDNYGPNATGNRIVAALDGLGEVGLIQSSTGTTPYGNPAYYYRAAAQVDLSELPLSPDDWMFIVSIVKKYGKQNRESVVRAAKATLRKKDAEQRTSLELRLNPDLEERQGQVLSNSALMAQLEESLQSREPGISLEELKASYAE